MTGMRNRPGKNEREAAARRVELERIRDEAAAELAKRKAEADVPTKRDS